MTYIIAAAWLVSTPFLLIIFANRRNLWSVPASRLARAVLYTIISLNVITATGVEFGFDPVVFGTPLFLWGGFLLLCFHWVRGVYLLCTPPANSSATSS